ncbi:hypothetical protein P152DRAFT_99696 [Eremomyces bilateralis CBS 781.70]|uniref:Uncharacterized protein n=1 Tax=Eremomyces bilateralis CBS 781.70 TaxID=1392243 RepID=A0A6G1FXP3_9PEZI|nr:uncharacterized protein P152DRAFT_99696 [Eremomyces bilateralis CBS 781.70]KAF1810482.1 hypothetical protein P152DRAFT_99696 [Eremomyces bilateralis CBS 781.70]
MMLMDARIRFLEDQMWYCADILHKMRTDVAYYASKIQDIQWEIEVGSPSSRRRKRLAKLKARCMRQFEFRAQQEKHVLENFTATQRRLQDLRCHAASMRQLLDLYGGTLPYESLYPPSPSLEAKHHGPSSSAIPNFQPVDDLASPLESTREERSGRRKGTGDGSGRGVLERHPSRSFLNCAAPELHSPSHGSLSSEPVTMPLNYTYAPNSTAIWARGTVSVPLPRRFSAPVLDVAGVSSHSNSSCAPQRSFHAEPMATQLRASY